MIEEGRPLFVQIAEDIENSIIDGSLAEDAQAPSTNELAAFYRINPATANKAFGLLVDEGTVTKRRGIGMFVTESGPQILREAGQQSYVPDHLGPALAEGLELGLSSTEILVLAQEFFAEKEQS